jgi:hypothetical protein
MNRILFTRDKRWRGRELRELQLRGGQLSDSISTRGNREEKKKEREDKRRKT